MNVLNEATKYIKTNCRVSKKIPKLMSEADSVEWKRQLNSAKSCLIKAEDAAKDNKNLRIALAYLKDAVSTRIDVLISEFEK